MRRVFYGACLLGLAACQSPSAPAEAGASTPDTRFDQLKQQFLDSLWYYHPEEATAAGNHRFDSLLVVPTAARRQVDSAFLARRRAELLRQPVAQLNPANQLDYQLLLNYVRASRWQLDTLREWAWNPARYNVGAGVGDILNGRYYPLDRRLRAISRRLDHVTDYYEAAKQNLARPTREHTELAILQNEGGLAVLGAPLLDSVRRSGLSEAEKQELTHRIRNARLTIENYGRFLREEVLAGGRFRSFRLGPALFSQKFDYEIQASQSAAQVYAQARQHKQYLLHDMKKRAVRLWPRYFAGQPRPADSLAAVRQVLSRLADEHATPAGFVAAVRRQIPALSQWVARRKLLTQDASKPLIVRETPLYQRGSGAGASISAPGPYDQQGDTYYNVDPLTAAPAAQAESYLREYNDYTLQILNIHEAIPGHYTQLVYANRAPSLIKSVLSNGAMVEGWAVYAERMMLESGYGNNTDELWLCWDKWNLRVTLNAILDYEVHVKNLDEAAALRLLQQDGFQEEAEARNKWRRATLSQVQLSSYFAGYTEIYQLRQELKQRQAAKFDLKAFHEQLLSYGSAPVKFIRRLMLPPA